MPSRQLTDDERQNKAEQEKAELAAAIAENDKATQMLEATPFDAAATPGAEAAAAEEPVTTEADPAAPATDDAAAPAATAAAATRHTYLS